VLRGDRSARFLLVSWLPMILLVPARILQVGGWNGPIWLDQAVGFGVAFAGIILIVGLADRMVQLRRERDRVSQLALYDGLTGAFSRGAVLQRLNAELELARASARPLSVIYGDIDGFKPVNDRHGHRVGDQCLRIVVMRVRNRLRGRDLLGRIGGDELLAVLPDTDLAGAVAVAESMRETVRVRPFVIEQLRMGCSLSLGVATWHADESAESLLERADAALYASKQGGRDRVTASD
jgi:diguanylate cyclase (GGDEF)-like protein